MSRATRPERRYVCGTCGAESLRWEGQCRGCGGWNTLVETVGASRSATASGRRRSSAGGRRGTSAPPPAVASLRRSDEAADAGRLASSIGELDRVLGGGLVAGSLFLLGGEPGIGKSTLLLDICGALARPAAAAGRPVLYASGEESTAQIRLRAARLGLADG
ncbi:MAG TPA: AAA family ATPase, partial [Candidatus Limnocylindria bacterium]|nr:AAA family ATPase [Candidatus Limnocylindria bacterium]